MPGSRILSGWAMWLTLAVAATDTLFAALFIAHGVVATLRAEIAGDAIRGQHHGIRARQMAATTADRVPIATIGGWLLI